MVYMHIGALSYNTDMPYMCPDCRIAREIFVRLYICRKRVILRSIDVSTTSELPISTGESAREAVVCYMVSCGSSNGNGGYRYCFLWKSPVEAVVDGGVSTATYGEG